jgi:putative nucleotidyltransferase with HDIG domain
VSDLLCDASEWRFPFCPAPPDWTLHWPALVDRFPPLQRLADCPQDAQWHAEGDVFIHTRMVCESLAAMPAWRQLPDADRNVVFAATLLHDIAKPECTREESGRITSRGHARRGAPIARQVVWDVFPDLADRDGVVRRETVVGLVRHHGLPLTWSDREDARRALVAASFVARCDWLALVAEADVRGRICADQQHLLDQVALFREFATELNCLDRPRAFTSDHCRVAYFARPGMPLELDVFDDCQSDVLVMSGLPGAGKDTWLRNHAPVLEAISLDELRSEFGVDPRENQGALIQEARDRARDYLRRRVPFAWNATNTTRAMRDQLIGLFRDYRARVRIVFVDVPPAVLMERNSRRAKQVPTAVIERLLSRLDMPDLTEAHEVEWVSRV